MAVDSPVVLDRRRIRAVFFDAVGTVIEPVPDAVDIYHDVGSRFGSRLTPDEVRMRFRQQMAADAADGETETDAEREYLRWQRIVANVLHDLDPTAARQAFRQLWAHFASNSNWRLFADVATSWERLRAAGFQRGIASNFDDRLDAIVQHFGPLASADYLFQSATIGRRKPDPDFYRAIQQRVEAAPHQLVMVGDSYASDYQAAREAGWQAIWLDRSNPSDGSAADCKIRSLDQLEVIGPPFDC